MKGKWTVFFLLLAGLLYSCLQNDTFNATVQLKTDTTLIRSFLNLNNISATKTSQGVWYSLDISTLGPYPALSDSVKISYVTRLIPSLAKVDSSANLKSSTRTVLLSSIISGLQIGLSRFPVGSSGKLYVPSGLAFGATPYNAIPANANLLYEIELVSASGSRLDSDKAAIDKYISSISDSLLQHSIGVHQDPSGLKYSYDSLIKNGTYPVASNYVTVGYTLNILNSKVMIKNLGDTTFKLSDQPPAWKIILPQITVGSNVTMYVPSGYGYGSNTENGIPANSNLVYQVKLKGVH